MKSFTQLIAELNEARMIATGDYRISSSGRKVRRLIKIGDDDYSKANDVDGDGDNDADDEKAKKMRGESVVPSHMQGKQKPYVSSDGKGNYEVLGNTGQTKATFSRKEHGKDAQSKAQAHLRSKYDEYMKEEVVDESVNKSDIPAYLRKKTGDQLTTKDLEKERTQNRSHPETLKKINGTNEAIKWPKEMPRDSDLEDDDEDDEKNTHRPNPETSRKVKESTQELDETRSVADRLAVAKQMYDQKMKSAKSPAERAQAKDDYANVVKRLKEEVEELEEVLDMRHHTTGTGSIHVSHTHTSPSRVHSIGYTDAHKISNLKAGEKHEYKNANGHETFTAHKQSSGHVHIHDNRGTHVATIKDKMGRYDGQVKEEKGLDNACWKGFKAIGLKTKNGKKVPNCVPEETQQEAYSMDDVRRDAADHIKKSIDKQSDDRIAALKDKKKPEGFLAKVGRKQINMVKGAYHGLTKESCDCDKDDVPFDKPYTKTSGTTTDKSGAKHDAMSKARHLARMAIAQQKKKKQG